MLGTDEYRDDSKMYRGVFEESSVKHVDLPVTLKVIEYGAFRRCWYLNSILLPEGLRRIGKYCFSESKIEEFVSPASMEAIGAYAFYECA